MTSLSVIIPVYNERESIPLVIDQLDEVLDGLGDDSEILVVDDGSTDGTRLLLADLCQKSSRLRVLLLKRNFGQTSAMVAGFHAAKGTVIVTMDADGQNDPRDIPALLKDLDEGYDVVSGWRRRRADNFFTRTIPSLAANWLLSEITGIRLHDFGCTLKAYRTSFIKKVRLYSDMHRFIPGLAAAVGAKVKEREVRHHARHSGVSKYGLGRTYKLLTDLVVLQILIRFSGSPLHYFGLASLGTFVASLAMTFLAFVDTTDVRFVNYSTVVLPGLAVLGFCLSVFFLMMGLLCELAVRVQSENSGEDTSWSLPMARIEDLR